LAVQGGIATPGQQAGNNPPGWGGREAGKTGSEGGAEIQTIAFQNSEPVLYVVSLAGSVAAGLRGARGGEENEHGGFRRFGQAWEKKRLFFTPNGRNPLKRLIPEK
jgi:hypothetical protein